MSEIANEEKTAEEATSDLNHESLLPEADSISSDPTRILAVYNISHSLTDSVDDLKDRVLLTGPGRLNSICRFCLGQADDLNIFDEQFHIVEMMSLISAVQISAEDSYPKQICVSCYVQLSKTIKFKKQVEAADVTLKQCSFQEISVADPVDHTQPGQESNKVILVESTSNDPENATHFDEIIEEDYGPEMVMIYEDDTALNSEFINKEAELDRVEESKPHEEDVQNLQDNSKLNVSAEIERFKCERCSKEFANQSLLNKHMQIHLPHPHVCGECHRSFPRAANLECHMRIHRAENTEASAESDVGVKCAKCDASFKVERDLFIHGSIHVHDGKNRCLECLKEFPNLPRLNRHIKTHYQDKPIKCDQCGRGFPEMASLTRHYRIHTNEQPARKYVCQKCDKSYCDSYSLQVHERLHTGEKPWSCTVCNRRFTDSRLLNSHMRIHTDQRNYACTMCEKTFTHRSTLVSHVRTHTGEKPYVCTICRKSFTQSTNLVHHMRVHSGEKPYTCTECPKRFSSTSTLSAHIRTHTGEKPYACKLCDKRFSRHNLTVHMRTHTGEKPYECNECKRTFRTSGQLTQHKLTHTECRTYVCKICKNRWPSLSYLRRHMKTHTINAEGRVSDVDDPAELAEANIKDDRKDVPFREQQQHRLRIEEIESDAEFNENAMLVNDLLASVVNVNTDVLQSGGVEMPELSTNDSNQDFSDLGSAMDTNRLNGMEDSSKIEIVADGVYVTEA